MLSAKFQAAAKANGIQHREPQMEWSILSPKGEDCKDIEGGTEYEKTKCRGETIETVS
jgi:hypothetical protein